MRLTRCVLLFFGSLFATACDRKVTVPCPSIASGAMTITVVDSLTNQRLSSGILVVLPDYGVVPDSFPIAGNSIWIEGGPGTYSIRVESDGYLTWTSTINVAERAPLGCGLADAIDVWARLKPAS